MKAKAAPLAFTRLEQAVLGALSWDLASTAPDLTGQVRESRPTGRLNSGSGFLTEILVSTDRPWPNETTSGDFGTVHCLVDGLRDPVAFEARLRGGRLVALVADAYGQDTRRIDWTTVRFEQVFTLGMRGESILFDPALSRTGQNHTGQTRRAGETRTNAGAQPRPRTPISASTSPRPTTPPPQTFHRPAAVPATVITTSGTATSSPPDMPEGDEPTREQLTTNAVGIWAVVMVGAVFLSWITDLPMVLTVIGGVVLARQMTRPDNLRSIARATSKAGEYRVSGDGKTLADILQRRD